MNSPPPPTRRRSLKPTTEKTKSQFSDGAPAIVENRFEKGSARLFASCPGIASIKEAKFVSGELKEVWPVKLRHLLSREATRDGLLPNAVIVRTKNEAAIEMAAFDSEMGTAVVLANFSYQPIEEVERPIGFRSRSSWASTTSSF